MVWNVAWAVTKSGIYTNGFKTKVIRISHVGFKPMTQAIFEPPILLQMNPPLHISRGFYSLICIQQKNIWFYPIYTV